MSLYEAIPPQLIRHVGVMKGINTILFPFPKEVFVDSQSSLLMIDDFVL